MDIKIRKAKLTKGGTLEAPYIDADGNEICIKGKNICHPDLKERLAALKPYFADLTEQKEAEKIDWDNLGSDETKETLRRLDVNGVSVGGDDSNPIATVTGRRTLLTSKVLNLNTPPTELNSDDSGWPYAEDFGIAIDAFFYEVEQYITERKWQVKQQELDFENTEDPFANPGITADAEAIAPESDTPATKEGQVA